ncbi:MAG TPA: efflux RND transporter periplasmic adaptor subunit [Vicinamibacterales bacterium]|jgi:multidrug efflux system membrane fusion protein
MMGSRRVILSIGAAVLAAGCRAGGEALPAAGAAAAPPEIPVQTAAVERQTVPITVDAVGTGEAFSTVALRSQITGELTSVNFTDGQEVEKGRVLFTLDRRPLDAALAQAEANLQRDLAQAANARAQSDRYRDLAQRGIATKEQLDTLLTNATALEATVAADRSAVENAKVQLTYATIVAPIAGRTGKLMVHPGNLVRANDTTPLVVINQTAPIYVSFGVPEAQLPTFKRAMAARPLVVDARPPDDEGPASRGRVSFIDNAIDQTTGTIEMRGTFANEDRRLWPGQFVNVTVTLGTEENATIIPSSAVQNGQQGAFVFVVKQDNTVDLRPIEIARSAGPQTVVRTGLTPGETVVTEGQLRLVPGSRVGVKPASATETRR